jgi:hypothetical protein
MKFTPVSAAIAVLVTLVALTSCSSPQPTTTVTAAPSPAVTVTATASAAPGDPLTSLDAWTVCYAFLTRYASRSDTSFVIPQLRSYEPQWVTVATGALQVQISPAGQPGDWTCTVAGTVGAPQILSWSDGN